jgi:hypothetical protein
MITSDDVLRIIRLKGPVLPMLIAKEAKLSTLFAGAYLSELVSNKKVFVTKVKVGSSPIYYVAGQESKLENYTKYLENAEQVAVRKLKEGAILKDENLDPVTRVALRNSPDYAIPVKVNIQSETVLYWKWFLLSNDQAEFLIRQKLIEQMEQVKHVEALAKAREDALKPISSEIKPEAPVTQAVKPKKVRQKKVVVAKKEEVPKEKELLKPEAVMEIKTEVLKKEPVLETNYAKGIRKEPVPALKNTLDTLTEQISSTSEKKPVHKIKPRLQKPVQRELTGTETAVVKAPEIKAPELKKPELKMPELKVPEPKQPELKVSEPVLKPTEPKPTELEDVFLAKVRTNFETKGIKILNYNIILKDKELDLVVNVPTPIGEVSYFCKAKKKALNTENDLYSALVAAQQKNLPGLFVTTGNITAKAKEILASQPNLVKFISLK